MSDEVEYVRQGEIMARNCFAYKSIALTLAITLVMGFLPVPSLAQEAADDTAGNACARGTMDGENVDTGIWFLAGCALGFTGWLIAYVVEPSPPMATLIGKDSEYTMLYLDCYKRSARAKQSKAALTGCGVQAGACALYYIIIFAVAGSASASEY